MEERLPRRHREQMQIGSSSVYNGEYKWEWLLVLYKANAHKTQDTHILSYRYKALQAA